MKRRQSFGLHEISTIFPGETDKKERKTQVSVSWELGITISPKHAFISSTSRLKGTLAWVGFLYNSVVSRMWEIRVSQNFWVRYKNRRVAHDFRGSVFQPVEKWFIQFLSFAFLTEKYTRPILLTRWKWVKL